VVLSLTLWLSIMCIVLEQLTRSSFYSWMCNEFEFNSLSNGSTISLADIPLYEWSKESRGWAISSFTMFLSTHKLYCGCFTSALYTYTCNFQLAPTQHSLITDQPRNPSVSEEITTAVLNSKMLYQLNSNENRWLTATYLCLATGRQFHGHWVPRRAHSFYHVPQSHRNLLQHPRHLLRRPRQRLQIRMRTSSTAPQNIGICRRLYYNTHIKHPLS